MRGAVNTLSVTVLLDPDTRMAAYPLTSHPESVVIEIGEYPAACLVHVRADDVDRLIAALAQARDLLQANASAVTA